MRYEFTFDLARGNLGCAITDDGGAFQFTMTSGEYCHTDLSDTLDIDGNAVTRLASVTDFATAFEAALNAQSSSGTYDVSYLFTPGSPGGTYLITYSGTSAAFSFSTATVAADGVRLRELIGMSGNLSAGTTHVSNRRPAYSICPTIEARSEIADEHEMTGRVTEASADDGTAYQTSVAGSVMLVDWVQHAEPDGIPPTSVHVDAGTPVFKRTSAGTITPWSYQHAWAHLKDGQPPFLVVDPSDPDGAVFEMRAEGCDFTPRRFRSKDYDLFSLDFKTRLLGRIPP